MRSDVQSLLIEAVQGDLAAFERVRQSASHDILAACEPISDITFTTEATTRVIQSHIDKTFPDDVVQAWGDFARFGYLKTDAGAYIETPFERDSVKEDEILEAVARLGELGDLIDGVMTRDECEQLLRTLTTTP